MRDYALYAHKFNMLVLDLPDLNERQKIFYFLHGLKSQVKTQVEMVPPTTLQEAIERADRVDATLYYNRPAGGYNANNGGGPVPMEMNAIGVKNVKPREERMCFFCKQHGHIARDCPNRQQNRRGARNNSYKKMGKRNAMAMKQEN